MRLHKTSFARRRSKNSNWLPRGAIRLECTRTLSSIRKLQSSIVDRGFRIPPIDVLPRDARSALHSILATKYHGSQCLVDFSCSGLHVAAPSVKAGCGNPHEQRHLPNLIFSRHLSRLAPASCGVHVLCKSECQSIRSRLGKQGRGET